MGRAGADDNLLVVLHGSNESIHAFHSYAAFSNLTHETPVSEADGWDKYLS
jgi:hypothetical protein